MCMYVCAYLHVRASTPPGKAYFPISIMGAMGDPVDDDDWAVMGVWDWTEKLEAPFLVAVPGSRAAVGDGTPASSLAAIAWPPSLIPVFYNLDCIANFCFDQSRVVF